MTAVMHRPAGTKRGAELVDRFRTIMEGCTGIKLPPSKALMIESRFRRRMIEGGFRSLEDYLDFLLEQGGLALEMPEVIDAITTNKTDFFREQAHFHHLVHKIVPRALSHAPRHAPVRFRLWSAAASTGAEAWSAAMLLAEVARQEPRFSWAIYGTDISGRVIETARRAIYAEHDVDPVPRDLASRYLMSGTGPNGETLARIVPELRAHVRFETMNLMERPYPVEHDLDVVMLRNVLIYFEPEVQARVTEECGRHLKIGGHLIVGHSESMTVGHPALVQVAPGIFRKKGNV